jgi:L-alanine-DL-glutamate epimerase-like enolase superfamily enzyme
MPQLHLKVERFPIAGSFVIARGAKTEAVVVVATLTSGGAIGRGECVPYARYGETADSVIAQIEALRQSLEAGLDRTQLQQSLAPGAARNALDCALWDLEAKQTGFPAYRRAGLDRLSPVTTAFTISVGTPEAMAAAAALAQARPLLKIKLAGAGDPERIAAVRRAAPDSELIVDANEAWTPDNLEENLAACATAGVRLVEQPLPADKDEALAQVQHSVPICADESAHDRHGLAALRTRYDMINIKLDKTGGLTEALALADAAQDHGFGLMIGCMVSSSLAMAPAFILTPRATFVDLDGPLLLAQDRPDGLTFDGSILYPPTPTLWG